MTDTIELSAEASSADTIVRPSGGPRAVAAGIRAAVANYGDVLRTVGTSFGVFGIFAVQGIILARLLGPEKRGAYGTVVFYPQALLYIGLLGTLLSIARHAARNRDGLPSLRNAAVRLGLMTGAGTSVVVIVLALVALPAEKQYLAPLCILCAFLLPWDHVRLTLLAVDHGSGAFRKYNRNLLVNAAVLPLLLGVLWALENRSLEAVAAATLLVPLVSLTYRFFSDGRGTIGRRAEPSPRTLVAEGIPYAFAQASSNIFNRLDGLLILWLASLTVQGYYAAAISAGSVLVAAPEALALFAFRFSARSSGRPSMRTLLRAGLAVTAVQVFTLLAFLALLEPLIVLVFGPSFREAVPYARVLLPAHAICGITYVAGGYLRGRRKASVEVWSRVVGAAVMVAAVFAFRARWQDLSVPLAAVCGHSTCAVLICWAVVRDVRRQNRVAHQSMEALAS